MIKSLVLGCGPAWPRRMLTHDETYVDRRDLPGVDVVHNLDVYPWPFADGAFDEVVAVHLVEGAAGRRGAVVVTP